MKQFIDFLPSIIFYIVYNLYSIYEASGALIIASFLVLLYSWFRYNQVEKSMLITFILVTVFSFLTIYFHNTGFIKWKITVIYILLTIALLFSQFISTRPILQRIIGNELILPIKLWKKLTISWSFFFLFCGLTNIYVAFWLPQSTWINFKVFGLAGMTLIFTLLNSIYINYYIVGHKK